ncbi:MAG: hypothetical protein EOP91_03530, partial [Lysobacteraceae bacterium]
MRPSVHPLVLALLLASPFAMSSAHASDAPAAAIDAGADAPSKTPRGTTFILPGGWIQKVQGNAVLVMPPEADGSRLAIVDAKAATADGAVAEAWAILGMTPKLMVASDAA